MQNDILTDLKPFGDTGFVVKNGNGVHVAPERLESAAQFVRFVSRIHASGYYFHGLDYALFLLLMDGGAPALAAAGTRPAPWRLASEILAFAPERMALYRTPVMARGEAEYLFEPVMIEQPVQSAGGGEGEGGLSARAGREPRVVTVRARLAVDEFIAAMWLKDIHYGIDIALVTDYIASGKSGRVVFARPREPGTSLDASVQEETGKLYRDNAPRKLADGKIDLKQFKNRFPQIRQGERLLRKLPRVLGEPGMDIGGHSLAAEMPQDFDLSTLAGEGTHIVRDADGECIVAAMDGFLAIDTLTNRIAVTEKIINYTGVSMRTTGDIALDGEHFEEHGEVQEKRVIEGRNITLMADVFGRVVSSGGTILLRQNLVGGSAQNHAGDIVIEGLTSNAVLQARKGTVTLQRAENSVIVGRRVSVDSAVNCTIVGENVQIQSAQGSVIAGKELRIAQTRAWRAHPSVVAVLLPDLGALRERTAKLEARIAEIGARTEALRRMMDELSQTPELRGYSIITGKLLRKEMTLTPEQKVNLQKLAQRVAQALKAAATIKAEALTLSRERTEVEGKLAAFDSKRRQAFEGIACSITDLEDETQLRRLPLDIAVLFDLPPRELNTRLRATGRPEDRLPAQGPTFFWRPAAD